MGEIPKIDAVQLNKALEQRVAGRDYFELFVPGSIKVLLATAAQTELDKRALENPRMFRYRFGFTATTPVREQVIAFQRQYDLLDDEIRWLRRAGHIRVTRRELIIDTSCLMPVCGWFQVTLVSLIFGTAILQLANLEHAVPWQRDLTQMGLALLWFCCAGVLVKMFINPWRTLKQVGAIAFESAANGRQ